MLNIQDVYEAQRKYSLTNIKTAGQDEITYATYLAAVRRWLSDVTPVDYYHWPVSRQREFTDIQLKKYVDSNKNPVQGFTDEDGNVEETKLYERLKIDLMDYGILSAALEDPEVEEIQINDFNTIWVVKHGKLEPYIDSVTGNRYRFVSDDELHSTVERLIYNQNGFTPRMTTANPLLNARTFAKGYRVSAVDSSVITPDNTPKMNFPCTSVTIRKYSQSRLMFPELCEKESLTPEMAKLLRYMGKADIKLACVGPVSSGKTTLLNSICWELPKNLKIILIQNPTEIMLYDRDISDGFNHKNVVHWEAQDLPGEVAADPTTPTMYNLAAHALRNTPDVLVLGETRHANEFAILEVALLTVPRIFTTWHAEGGGDAVARAAHELQKTGGTAESHAQSIANGFDVIVTQKKLADGRRKIMAIEELTGKLINGRAETRVLYRFKLEGESIKDENGEVLEVKGHFERCNPISERLLDKFYVAGFSKSDLEDFIKPVEPLKEEPKVSAKSVKTTVLEKSKSSAEILNSAYNQVFNKHVADDYTLEVSTTTLKPPVKVSDLKTSDIEGGE